MNQAITIETAHAEPAPKRAAFRAKREGEAGLSWAHQDALRDLWCNLDAAMGVQSTFGAAQAAWAGIRGGSSGHDPEAAMHDRLDRHRAKADKGYHGGDGLYGIARATRAAVHRMEAAGEGRLVAVLYRFYGPERFRTHADFGEVARIVDMTEEAEDAREALAATLGEATGRTSTARLELMTASKREEYAVEFWRIAGQLQKLARRPPTDENRAKRDAWRIVQGRILDAFAYDGRIAVACNAFATADRQVTAWDAIELALTFQGRREANGKPNADALRAWEGKRKAIVERFKVPALALRVEAGQAFTAAAKQ